MSEKKGSAQSSTPTVRVRRIYDEVQKSDGTRVLVDRVWPRGVSKDKAELDEWIKDVAPSTELRKWYSHDPEKFDEFARRFRKELDEDEAAEALDSLRDLAKKGTLTLLTAAKRDDISQATVLAEILNGGKQTSGKQTNSKQTSSKQTSDKKKTSSSSNDGKDGQ
ncbi:DUF488 domain-containing protein [Brevibacterium sp. LE-L]|uniref:DUF488 domain-containing protein n=1 Tax=unclassified Brevibacterium TaxID=2614124 RepID=UPI003CF4CEC3